jgi:hypothetical protein
MTSKIILWQKWAHKPDKPEKDLMQRFNIEEDPKIREVLREFESKTVVNKLNFDDVHPENSSVKKWILKIFNSGSDVDEEIIEDLINTFRFSLYPRSKKKLEYIVGVLLLHDTLILLHSKKLDTLVESDKRIFPAEVILSVKNVLRAAVIKDEDGGKTFSAFEYNHRLSRGHAEFWQIAPDDVNWESIGNFSLYINIDGFDLPIILPVDSDHLDEMVNNHYLTPTGKVSLGRTKGKVTKVKVLRKVMDFDEFYEFYILRKENLNQHKSIFTKIITDALNQLNLDSTFDPPAEYYEYFEDLSAIYEYSAEGDKLIKQKKHPRYLICYFTQTYPRIKPNHQIVSNIYQAIFENRSLQIWHVGEQISNNPYILGSLEIYNELRISPENLDFGNTLLNIIQDLHSRKERLILQYLLCEYWKNSSHCKHFPVIFDHIAQSILIKEINYEFKSNAISTTEKYLEYKSASVVSPRIKLFVKQTLVPTIHSYIKNGILSRYAIIYGIEDNGAIHPIYHLKNDMVTDIQITANEILKDDGIKVRTLSIPFNDQMLLLVLLVPPIN